MMHAYGYIRKRTWSLRCKEQLPGAVFVLRAAEFVQNEKIRSVIRRSSGSTEALNQLKKSLSRKKRNLTTSVPSFAPSLNQPDFFFCSMFPTFCIRHSHTHYTNGRRKQDRK